MLNRYPYTDFHELNLDWILAKIKELGIKIDDFMQLNKITYSGPWDIANQYPAWTVVFNDNIGYLSLQPVSAGISLGDINYWVPILDYTIAMEQKRYILVSDSYGGVTNPWTAEFKNRLGLSDSNCYITYGDGYGFKPPYNAYFLTLLQNLEGSVVSPDGITDIIVVGGFNDRSTSIADIGTAIASFVTYAKSQYPNAHVWIGGAGWSFNYEFLAELTNGTYLTAYKSCERFGATYLHGMDYIMHDKGLFLEEDQSPYTLFLGYKYVHPNQTAGKMIVDCVLNNLNGGAYSVHSKSTATITPASGVATMTGANTFVEMQDDNMITASFGKTYFYLTTPHAVEWGEGFVELATISDGKIAGSASTNSITRGGTALGFIVNGSNLSQSVPIELYVVNNRLYARLSTDNETFSVVAISSASISLPITMA